MAQSQASFSACGLYRWSLERKLRRSQRIIIYLGLNPSKASFSYNDQTLRRLINSCYLWGYGSLIVINLFARVNSSPSIIKRCHDPIGKDNDKELLRRAYQWEQNPLCDLWLGWGDKGTLRNRNVDVMKALKKNATKRRLKYPFAKGPLAIGVTKKGHPRHPLYCSHKEGLKPFYMI